MWRLFFVGHVTSVNQGLCRSPRGGIKTLACEVGATLGKPKRFRQTVDFMLTDENDGKQ